MRLCGASLSGLPSVVRRFGYDRAAVRGGVVHLGIGAFHRAHQAIAFEDALEAGDPRWGVTGVSLRSPAVRDQLGPQDGLYTVTERDGADERMRVVGAIREVLVAPEDPARVVAAMAAPDVHLVTLTVTEKGYKLAGGDLDRDDPDVAHDLAQRHAPRTAPGFLVAGLAARRAAGLPPFTVLSCDNLPHNGALLRRVVLAIARAHDPALADWIAAEVAFPQSMVDRIVPATNPADLARMAERLGIEDRAAVKTEPFLQWVIEDRFCAPRPAFAQPGIHLTGDVAPWEEMKLRLLNGAHSGIAYLGGLAGIPYVHSFVADDANRRFVETLWDEAEATLTPPAGFNLGGYRAALMARFANGALEHRTRQIAMDGSQKLPQRLLAPLAERRARGLASPALVLAVAAWMRWQGGIDDAGRSFAIDDPRAGEMATALAGVQDPRAIVDALMALPGLWPATLRTDRALAAEIANMLALLAADGARAGLTSLDPARDDTSASVALDFKESR